MKIFAFLLSILGATNYSNAQLSSAQLKKLKKFAGQEFVSLSPQGTYNYFTGSASVIADKSITNKNDTTGIHTENEYLLFRDPIAFRSDREELKLLKRDYVTVAEYLEFQQYVCDSIARERIYSGLESDEASSYILVPKNNVLPDGRRFDPSNRAGNRPLYAFNLKHSFSYSDQELVPLLADIYLPQPERFYKQRDLDERKLLYRYFEDYSPLSTSARYQAMRAAFSRYNGSEIQKLENQAATIADYYSWAAGSVAYRDQLSVIAQTYTELETFRDQPMIGLTGGQAKAFCHWRQEQLQQLADKQQLHVTVLVTLPDYADVENNKLQQQLTLPAFDYTSAWKITSGDYQKFIYSVRDSILKEQLYEKAGKDQQVFKLLDYKNYYFDEGMLEWVELDPEDKKNNRYYFPLASKLPALTPELKLLAEEIKASQAYTAPVYCYYDLNANRRSITGTFTRETMYLLDHKRTYTGFIPDGRPLDKKYAGKDLDLDFATYLGYGSTGVRSHENFARFIDESNVAVFPAKGFNEYPPQLVTGITYEQAVAYYHWKYPIHKLKASDSWQQFVIPTEEQFHKVQSGETIVVPEEKIDYPTPLFRYVVHVYPKAK